MTEPNFVGSLQVNQDMAHERREWRLERVAWVVFSLILLAALLGLFGDGPLAQARAGRVGSGLWVDYERLERARDSSQLQVYLLAPATDDGLVRLSLNRDYFDKIDVTEVYPQPASHQLAGDRVIYTIEVEASDQPLQVTIEYEAISFGTVDVRLAVESGPSVEFRQFVFP